MTATPSTGATSVPDCQSLGITSVRTPFRAPRANAIAERLVRSIRQECLDHVIVINERHLRAVLVEFAEYYNLDRPHRSLRLQSPLPRPLVRDGPVTMRSVLGGLHHVCPRRLNLDEVLPPFTSM